MLYAGNNLERARLLFDRAKFTWRQLAGLLKRAAEGKQKRGRGVDRAAHRCCSLRASHASRSKLYQRRDRRPDPGDCLRGNCSFVASRQTALAMTGQPRRFDLAALNSAFTESFQREGWSF
jgi:hypothetical protein